MALEGEGRWVVSEGRVMGSGIEFVGGVGILERRVC